jgi:hypothetical protein
MSCQSVPLHQRSILKEQRPKRTVNTSVGIRATLDERPSSTNQAPSNRDSRCERRSHEAHFDLDSCVVRNARPRRCFWEHRPYCQRERTTIAGRRRTKETHRRLSPNGESLKAARAQHDRARAFRAVDALNVRLMRMPDRVTPADLRESLKVLLEMDRHAMAVRTLERVMDDIHDQHAWVELREVISESVGPEVLQRIPWTGLYARVLRGCRDAKTILEISQGSDNPSVQLERAWALIFMQQFEQADAILEMVIPVLTGSPLGLAYRFKASIQFEQGKDWRSTWVEVRSRLQGRALGVALLDEVYQLMQSSDGQHGRESALEASALLAR